MTENSIGVAVIGVGMVGRAHAAGYRTASSLFDIDRPDTRLVAIADAYEPFAVDAAKLRALRDVVGGDRGRPRHRRRQRRGRQLDAP